MRFILVDEILELAPGRHIIARKFIAPEEDYFRDHFPGFPVVPGVLLTEMMAQAAGKCLVAEDVARGRPMLAQIKSASFREYVRPGQTVSLMAEIKVSRPQFAIAICRAEVNGEVVCSAGSSSRLCLKTGLPLGFGTTCWNDFWQTADRLRRWTRAAARRRYE